MDFKQLAENILNDLMGNTSITDVLLKTKIFASLRNDVELLSWINKELNGYETEVPSYRNLTAGIKIQIFKPFQGYFSMNFNLSLIQNDSIRDIMSKMPFYSKLGELEDMVSGDDGDGIIARDLPLVGYGQIAKYIYGDIQQAQQYVSKAAVKQIVVSVKSILIDYLLKFNEEETIDFISFAKSQPTMVTNNITAAIVNTGNGSIDASNSTNVVGDSNNITISSQKELLDIIDKLDLIALEMKDEKYSEISMDIRSELNSPSPSKKFLTRCFQAIPSVISGISTGIIANEITPLIEKALSLIN